MNTEEDNKFHLFAQAYGHSSDVRDVVGVGNGMFASCSRDGTIRLWHREGDTYVTKKVLTGHRNVNKMGTNALFYIPPGRHPIFKEGALVSSAFDKSILIWDVDVLSGNESEPRLHLAGHLEAPTCFSLSPEGNLISGGSDNFGRVWLGNRCVQELRGHAFPVWAVIGLPNGDIVTGSGDKTIKIWRKGVCIKTLTDSSEAVRGLAVVPDIGFLSCGNDALIRLWSNDGMGLHVIPGHHNFIYKVIVLPTGEYASASEDGTVKIWKDMECSDTLGHPTGVWSLDVLSNGDIVTAGQDGILRVWSRDPSRKIEPDLLHLYHQDLAKKQTSDLGDLKLDQLPGPEALLVPGNKEGQSLMLKRDGKAWLYVWNSGAGTWDDVGEITNATKTSDERNQKRQIAGVEYDHVFDVELGDGGPMRQLGYNNGENPYLAAQQFIIDQSLDQNFLSQIAQFIIQNVPQAAEAKGHLQPRVPKAAAPEARIAPSKSKLFPQRRALRFDTGNIDQMVAKIKEFNDQLAADKDTASLALNPIEWSTFDILAGKIKQTSKYHATSILEKEFLSTLKLLSWPASKLFPVLDFLRMMILHPEAAKYFFAHDVITKVLTVGLVKENAHHANTMLTFKFISNCFMLETIRAKISKYESEILDKLSESFEEANKNTRLALATTLLNFSVFYLTNPSEEGIERCVSLLSEFLAQEQEDSEVLFRLLVALATLIYANKELQKQAEELDLLEVLDKISKSNFSNTEKIVQCVQDIKNIYKN